MSIEELTALITNKGINHEDPKRLALWIDLTGSFDLEDLELLAEMEQEHYLGQYASPADFAEESLSNTYDYELEALPDAIRNCIDWSQVWDRYYRFDCIDVEINDESGYNWHIWHAH